MLDELVELHYAEASVALPGFVRAASALRRFRSGLVIVQDDVDALAIREPSGAVRAVELPARGAGSKRFDDELGNKLDKLDLEACMVLPDARLVAFGSGALPVREQLVIFDGTAEPVRRAAGSLYDDLRVALGLEPGGLNLEGAVVAGERVLLFHRGNDARRGRASAVAEVRLASFVRWLDGEGAVRVERVTEFDLGSLAGVPFGFTDAVAADARTVVVLACAERSDSAIADGPVLGCRVGAWTGDELTLVDVRETSGEATRRKLEGIEVRGRNEFDVVVDVDSFARPAQLGRLTWAWG